MSILSVENLHKSYGDKVLFESISFTIEARDRIGLIGVNGTGKSTLLKVLAGIQSKEQGEMKHANDFTVQYLSQEPELDPDLTVLEQIYYGESDMMKVMRRYEQTLLELGGNPQNEKLQDRLINVQQQMDQYEAWDANTTAKMILTKLGITAFDKKTQDLSGGQKKRVAIASALIQPADLLILDEPTNHLDNPTIEWLEGYLPQYKGAIILVTHDRYFLNRITNHIYELDKGNLYIYEGNYETFLTKKAQREEQEILHEQKHKNTLRRELEWLRRGAKARTTKQKARIQRVEDMKDKTFDTSSQNLDFQVGSTRLGKKVMEVEGITKAFEGENVVEDFNLLLTPNDRIGIIGPNGSGKTTLLNMLAGRVEPDKGSIDVGPTVKIGYYTQDHSEMDENLRVIEYVREEAEVVHTADGDTITAEQMLERFLFPRSQQWTYIRKLSGGERRRLYLLRVLMGEPNVLFLDEPTNDLDTQTLGVLEDYLEVFPGVVITVSHDRYFLDRVVEKLIVFSGKAKTDSFYGNYTDYLEKWTQDKKLEAEKVAKEKPQQRQSPKRKKLSYKDQKEWDEIEDKITELELAIEEAKEKIVEAGSDLEKVQKHFQKQQELETELEAKMERWEELSLMVEEIENQ